VSALLLKVAGVSGERLWQSDIAPALQICAAQLQLKRAQLQAIGQAALIELNDTKITRLVATAAGIVRAAREYVNAVACIASEKSDSRRGTLLLLSEMPEPPSLLDQHQCHVYVIPRPAPGSQSAPTGSSAAAGRMPLFEYDPAVAAVGRLVEPWSAGENMVQLRIETVRRAWATVGITAQDGVASEEFVDQPWSVLASRTVALSTDRAYVSRPEVAAAAIGASGDPQGLDALPTAEEQTEPTSSLDSAPPRLYVDFVGLRPGLARTVEEFWCRHMRGPSREELAVGFLLQQHGANLYAAPDRLPQLLRHFLAVVDAAVEHFNDLEYVSESGQLQLRDTSIFHITNNPGWSRSDAPQCTLDNLAIKYCYVNTGAYAKDGALAQELLRRTLIRLKRINPSIRELTLQCDGANKNWALFSMAEFLVLTGVVDKVRAAHFGLPACSSPAVCRRASSPSSSGTHIRSRIAFSSKRSRSLSGPLRN
jgi:hypothetical protein